MAVAEMTYEKLWDAALAAGLRFSIDAATSGIIVSIPVHQDDEQGNVIANVIVPIAASLTVWKAFVKRKLRRLAANSVADVEVIQSPKETRQEIPIEMLADVCHQEAAKALDRQWEASLIALRQAEAEYQQMERSQPATLSIAEQERIRALATDLPSLWHSSATRPEDRKAILRCLIEKVVVHIPSENENIRVVIQWRGGITSEHKAVRPILEYRRLEGYADLRSKLTDWRKAGLTTRQIASRLNAEGIRPIKRAEQFAPAAVRKLLSRWGVLLDKDAHGPLAVDEWMLPDLLRTLGVDGSKFRSWIRRGWVQARQTPCQKLWVVWADTEELQRLRMLCNRSYQGIKSYPPELITPKRRLST